MSNVAKYSVWGVKGLLTLAFVAAGGAKLMGVEMMVGTFEAIGWGQWFRYVTGIIEVGAAIMLWVPGLVALGAFLLTSTMVCAVIAHLAVLGPSPMPATVLGLLSALILYLNRHELSRMKPA